MIINRGNLDLIPRGHQHTAQLIKQSLFVWMSNEAEVEEQNVWICAAAPLPRFWRGRWRERSRRRNLCKLVCPVDNCITMEEHRVAPEYLNWIEFQKRGLPLNDH